jgi:TetR/AcrR family transcriptional regulator, transcriptional repressor for nem operon
MAIAKHSRSASRPRVKTKLDPRRAAALGESAGRILDVAERLVQMRGFNGMSYADIATALGVTNASIHYHFPTKSDLGGCLIRRYEENFTRALGSIDARAEDPGKKLRAYARIYEDVLRDNRMCLCGMLAAELDTLPSEMKARLSAFFDANEAWLGSVLEQGRSAGRLAFDGAASAKARMLVSCLEGAMLLARSYGQGVMIGSV